jgi:nucleotide-binding universal stress UspA family protein
MMKIVIAYDGSRSADAAVDEVLRRAWPAGTEVRIVTAVPAPTLAMSGEGMAFYGPMWDRALAAAREQAHGQVQQVLDRFRARPDLKTGFELRDDTAKSAILDVVRRWGADLLVLGSQGTTAMGRLFVGSVCHAMVSHAPCTVEIVRPPLAA